MPDYHECKICHSTTQNYNFHFEHVNNHTISEVLHYIESKGDRFSANLIRRQLGLAT